MRQRAFSGPVAPRLHHLIALGVIALLCFALHKLEQASRPIIYSMVEYECKAMVVQTINETVLATMQQRPELFAQLCRVSRDEEGQIRAITTDAYAVSELKLILTQEVNRATHMLEDTTHHIPIGNILGIPLLSGIGPNLSFKIISEAYAESEITSGFEAAGVNQTRFSVDIVFDVTISTMMGGYNQSLSTFEKIPLVEMILEGEVPRFYAA